MQIMTDQGPISVEQLFKQFVGVLVFNPSSPMGSAVTLTDKHHGLLLRFEGACTVTVPSGLRRDFSCGWSQEGEGAITFVAGAGATLQSLNGLTESGGQYADGGIYAVLQPLDDTASVYRLTGSLA